MAESRKATVARIVLGGPIALIVAILAMAGTPFWFPKGAAQVDHLVFAILLFPVYWSVGLLYVILDERIWRAAVIMSVVAALNSAFIALLLTA